jgi:phospholipid transport system transporter-binding protein
MSTGGFELDLDGAVTFATHVALLARARALIARGDVTIDWVGAEAVDSSALALILACRRCAQAAGHRVEQRNLPGALVALAELYGVRHLVAA